MKCLVLAAGYATRLYPLTENFPKPLLDVKGKAILDWLLQDIDNIPEIDEHIIISNHRFYEHFIRWKESCNLKKPVTLLDDGSTANENRLGAVRDIQFAIEKLQLKDDLLVIAGDNLLDFSLAGFIEYAKKKGTSCIMCYKENDLTSLQKCGVMTPDENWRVVSMIEKPQNPPTKWAVPPFYVYKQEDVPLIKVGIENGCGVDAPGSIIAWLCQKSTMHAWVMSGKRYDIGDRQNYESAIMLYSNYDVDLI